MNVAYKQRELTEQTDAVEHRLGVLLRHLNDLLDQVEEGRHQIRIALAQLDELRAAQHAHGRAVD